MNKTLLIIGFVWPEPKSSAAGSRMLQLIAFFQSEGYQITFASACAKSDNAFDLSSISVETVSIKLNHSSFDEFVSNLNPELVLFDRFMTEEQFGWRVSEQCPDAIKVLDTEDLHFLRRARQQAFKTNAKVSDADVFSDTAKREIAAVYRCDLSLIISKAEMILLKDQFNINDSLLFYLPFLVAHPSEAERGSYPDFEARQHFISIGNFLHEPNYNALLYLKETLWKGIKQQLPQAQLLNYGAYASQKVTQLHNEKDGFLIKGFADDVSTVMQQAKVLLAPIRFGAGLKGKLFDAMQNGTPFVSTTIGLEGIIDTNTQDYCCDQPEDFINHAVKLYQDKSLWQSQQWLGFEVLNTKFSKSEFEVALRQRLKALMQHLEQHRQQNFIGQMLQHHTLQSTKYMGKWIEAKNA